MDIIILINSINSISFYIGKKKTKKKPGQVRIENDNQYCFAFVFVFILVFVFSNASYGQYEIIITIKKLTER